jgi:hypothetical protein
MPRPAPSVRALTAAETALARRVFGDGIDYGRVRVHSRGFLPFGLQQADTSMAPNGHLYCGPRQYRADFGACGPAEQLHFIHEMAHVWQHQRGYRVWWHGLLLALRGGYIARRAYAYADRLAEGARFQDFNMEQQADLLAHWFACDCLDLPAYAARRVALHTALAPFLADPSRRELLPKKTW